MWHAERVRFYDFSGDGQVVVGVLALACCVIETEAAFVGYPIVDEPAPGARVVIVVAGTVTDAMAPIVAAEVNAYPDAPVIAFGACASAGGPYWDSPVVTKGVDQLVPVDIYVAGCPPTPAALLAAVQQAVAHPAPAAAPSNPTAPTAPAREVG